MSQIIPRVPLPPYLPTSLPPRATCQSPLDHIRHLTTTWAATSQQVCTVLGRDKEW